MVVEISAIIDDEPLVFRQFAALSSDYQGISDLVRTQFDLSLPAEDLAEEIIKSKATIVFLDEQLSRNGNDQKGKDVATHLKSLKPEIFIVGISAKDQPYADYYLGKLSFQSAPIREAIKAAIKTARDKAVELRSS